MAGEPPPAPPPPAAVPITATAPEPASAAAVAAASAAPSFEERVGTRWAVRVGGAALAVGGVFLVNYSIEAGLIGPTTRIVFGALFALALTGAGEWMRRGELASVTSRRASLARLVAATRRASMRVCGRPTAWPPPLLELPRQHSVPPHDSRLCTPSRNASAVASEPHLAGIRRVVGAAPSSERANNWPSDPTRHLFRAQRGWEREASPAAALSKPQESGICSCHTT
jgi:hypothetical protein